MKRPRFKIVTRESNRFEDVIAGQKARIMINASDPGSLVAPALDFGVKR